MMMEKVTERRLLGLKIKEVIGGEKLLQGNFTVRVCVCVCDESGGRWREELPPSSWWKILAAG
jgi:hypothetical protein